MMAMGSPATLALGTIGSVVSHWPVPELSAGAGLERSHWPLGGTGVPGCAAVGWRVVAATGRAVVSRVCAESRSAANRVRSDC
ncbi:hypothetical protein MCHLDSM_01534 [Mycolicibacterium chlorophenolicum]|uniref:Uncharacterized protein n=1 Tax=Mycolicibacterium chlorophenolicum TaxID=37916 RepID=A0A0J6WGE7_9MYCO|nr:hypothetical protein MCHLDSM_01534 [Mycolicibacterium chlorophenolicum]